MDGVFLDQTTASSAFAGCQYCGPIPPCGISVTLCEIAVLHSCRRGFVWVLAPQLPLAASLRRSMYSNQRFYGKRLAANARRCSTTLSLSRWLHRYYNEHDSCCVRVGMLARRRSSCRFPNLDTHDGVAWQQNFSDRDVPTPFNRDGNSASSKYGCTVERMTRNQACWDCSSTTVLYRCRVLVES